MAEFPMAGGRCNVPILFSKSQAENEAECFFSRRVEQGYLALPRLCDDQPIGRLEMDRANDISEPEF